MKLQRECLHLYKEIDFNIKEREREKRVGRQKESEIERINRQKERGIETNRKQTEIDR